MIAFSLKINTICFNIQNKNISYLHRAWDTFSVTQNFMQIFGSKNISESGLRQKASGMMRIFNIGHWDCCVWHTIINDSVYRNCHRVFGQHLKMTSRMLINFDAKISIYEIKINSFHKRCMELTSWGGTLNVMVRKSTFWYDSMQGSTKNIPKVQKYFKLVSFHFNSIICFVVQNLFIH